MQRSTPRLRWSMSVEIFHDGPRGHYIQLATEGASGVTKFTPLGSWRTFAMPEAVLRQAIATVEAAFTEHCITRYGVQGGFSDKWSGEPDPF